MEVRFSRVSSLAACHPIFFFFFSFYPCFVLISCFFVLGKLTELKLSGVMQGDWVSFDSFV